MVSTSSETPGSDRSTPAQPGITPQPAPTAPGWLRDGPVRALAVPIVAGLVAGVTSLLVGEAIMNVYRGDLLPRLMVRPDPEVMRRLDAARIHSATASFATMGGILGLAMGLSGGLVRRSAAAGARAAILGLLLGAGAVATVALVIVPIFFKSYDPHSTDLVLPLLTHGALWLTAGATGGLALGWGLGGGRWKNTLAGGAVGAAGATIVYEIAGALAFPAGKTDLPLSSSMAPRAMAQLLVAILTAVGAVLALRLSPKGPPSSSVSA
jgi:hypothetical protein